jgi:hypothetical protein
VNKIVTRGKDGSIEKGSTCDFRPNKDSFHIELAGGEVSLMAIDDLKAVFFVKDLTGQPERNDLYQDEVPGGGRKVQVTFLDGEVFVGFTGAYSNERLGWFLVPADNEGNNVRVFVVNSAVADVSFPG